MFLSLPTDFEALATASPPETGKNPFPPQKPPHADFIRPNILIPGYYRIECAMQHILLQTCKVMAHVPYLCNIMAHISFNYVLRL